MDLLLVALAGFLASLVDGALGMGFGPTSSSLLLGAGLPPSTVSTTVNLAKVAAGAAGGVSHWRFGNIDRRLVLRLAVPGCLGALVGVTVLSRVDSDAIRPFLAVLLLLVGIRMMWRFSSPLPTNGADPSATTPDQDDGRDLGVVAAGAVGGVTNGMIGAWGPVVTPVLMHRGHPPRFAIGSVNTAEVAVAAVSAVGLIAALGREDLDVPVVIAMLIGGVAAAPLAASAVKHVPARPMGIAVASLLMVTNTRELCNWLDIGALRWAGYVAVLLIAAAAYLRPRLWTA